MKPEVKCAECGTEWQVPYLRSGVVYVCASHVYETVDASKPGHDFRVGVARAMAALAKKHGTSAVSLCAPPTEETP